MCVCVCVCVNVSLVAERAVTSPTESAAIVSAVVECMRFSVLQHTEEGEEQRKIQRMLISQQVGSHGSSRSVCRQLLLNAIGHIFLHYAAFLPLASTALGKCC